MKFTAYQHKRIAQRYLVQINGAMSQQHNEAMARKAQPHIAAYIALTGHLPED